MPKKNNTETIMLGSGDCYCMEFTETVPEDQEIETDDNLIGRIQGGASVEYKPTFYTAKDDSGRAQKTIITEEEATFKTGVITWNSNTLAQMSATARVVDGEGKRTLKVGGVGNDNGKKYLIRFVHKNAAEGDVRVTIVGKNEAGFTLAFAKDKETVIDAEFKAQPLDGEGTLIQYDETVKEA